MLLDTHGEAEARDPIELSTISCNSKRTNIRTRMHSGMINRCELFKKYCMCMYVLYMLYECTVSVCDSYNI